MNLVNLKKELIAAVKRYYSNEVIYPTYSGVKQANMNSPHDIGGYTAQEKTDMATFINGKLSDIVGVEADVNALTDLLILSNWNQDAPGDVAAKRVYVASYCPNLTDDEQRDAIANSLQIIKLPLI